MKKKLSFLALLCLLCTSCDLPLKPMAKIDVDKTTIKTGEYLSLNGSGSKYDHLEWTLPDEKSTSTYVSFMKDEPGKYSIKLIAWSKRERHKDEEEITITVEEADPGELMVWTPNPNIVGFQIFVDTEYKGTISAYYPGGIGGNPCGSGGCVTTTLSAGSHTVTATNGSVTFNGTAHVISNGCAKFYVN